MAIKWKVLAVVLLMAACAGAGYQYNEYRWQAKWNDARADTQEDARDTEAEGSAMASRIEANTLALTEQIHADERKTKRMVAKYEEKQQQPDRSPACAEHEPEDDPANAGEGDAQRAGSGDAGEPVRGGGYLWRLGPDWVRGFNASLGRAEAAGAAAGGDERQRAGVTRADALRAATNNNIAARKARGKLRQCRDYIRGLCKTYGCQSGPQEEQ